MATKVNTMITINFLWSWKKSIEIDAETIAEAVEKALESGVSLSEANLCGAELSEANLRGADLRYATLFDADLRGANLRGANLRSADLRSADLRGANLDGADLDGADLRGADLREANLRGANLNFSCWPLWCGSLRATIDKKLFCQLLYHTLSAGQSVDDEEVKALLKNPAVIALANQFHRMDECGKLKGE